MAKLPINGAQYEKVIALVDFIGTAVNGMSVFLVTEIN